MKKLLVLLCACVIVLSCDDKKEGSKPDRALLLAGEVQKTWYLYETLPEEKCGSSIDDSWIFFADGTFEFDHGVITDDEENECGDFVNLLGTWEITSNETLAITAIEEKGNPENEFDPLVIIAGEIETLSEDQLILVGTHNDEEYSFEFRKID